MMLQQTQTATVMPFYEAFLQRFPTVRDLAAADREEVLSLWAGLGYYRRAHLLHEAARTVVSEFGGRFPPGVADLMSLPGVGRYTAGAVASIAFDMRAPVLDGNVKRVLCRLLGVRKSPTDAGVTTYLWDVAEAILPKRNCGRFNEALMDLGATICQPQNPRCPQCPLKARCVAHQEGLTDAIPRPARRPELVEVRLVSVLVVARSHVLLRRRPPRGLWSGMWEVPSRETNGRWTLATLRSLVPDDVVEGWRDLEPLGTVRHTLTHRRVQFEVFRATSRRVKVPNPYRWLAAHDPPPLPKAFAKVLALQYSP
jgi:A/G-specific adenine glycosylase